MKENLNKDSKELKKDAEEVSRKDLKQATGGHGTPISTKTKDVTKDVKDRV